ncbi:hypothetical protein R3P38DRAFT_3195349 [Favolaschia claudopus]|uniref:Uncharacterized protein n=1 Tax=Favolaschia claudopus TaxID=2862362 RepID=A0AAW0BCC9_9AGAR
MLVLVFAIFISIYPPTHPARAYRRVVPDRLRGRKPQSTPQLNQLCPREPPETQAGSRASVKKRSEVKSSGKRMRYALTLTSSYSPARPHRKPSCRARRVYSNPSLSLPLAQRRTETSSSHRLPMIPSRSLATHLLPCLTLAPHQHVPPPQASAQRARRTAQGERICMDETTDSASAPSSILLCRY